MKNNFSKLIKFAFVLPMIFTIVSCSSNEEEVITEVDDTEFIDEDINTSKTVPEGYLDPNTD